MMDTAFYISELLYTSDCVILPGFGGFVSQYAAARIHPINHTFYPPSKQVLFNSKLTRDDGLLIDFIAQKENLDYTEAKQIVASYVSTIIGNLQAGHKFVLYRIGSFRKDVEGQLLFDPDPEVNYLEDAFGLHAFVSPPVIRKAFHKRKEGLFIDRKPETSRNKKRKAYWAALAVIPVLLLVGWFIIRGNKTPDLAQQSSMLNFTEDNSEASPASTKKIIDETTPPIQSLDLSESQEQKASAEGSEKAIVKPTKLYYIIGGSFGQEANADRFLHHLISKGYDASRAGISPSGLNMVSYMSTPDKDEALVNLGIIRRDDNPSAWLIRK